MSMWSDLRNTLDLPTGKRQWGTLLFAGVLLVAGWVLQERVSAPDPFELDYSALCKFIEEGKVELLVIKGQSVYGDFYAPQIIAGHRTEMYRATVPLNDPSFLPLLHDKSVRVRVIATGPGILTRFVIAALPLVFVLGLALWGSRRPKDASAQ